MDVAINYWAVLVAAAVNMVVGSLWYSPVMFSKEWMKLVDAKQEKMSKNAGPGYAIAVVVALTMAVVLSDVVHYAGATTITNGASVGAMLWLGFVAATSGLNTAFAGRPWKLWAIDSLYFLVVMLINGALLATWQ
jgi:hypothetical protein